MAITAKLPDAVITASAGVGGMVVAVARTVCVQGGKLKREWQDNTQQLQSRNRCSPSGLGLVFDMKWSSVTAPNPRRNMSACVYLFTLTQRQWLAGLLFICNRNGTSIKNMQKEKKQSAQTTAAAAGWWHQNYISYIHYIGPSGDHFHPWRWRWTVSTSMHLCLDEPCCVSICQSPVWLSVRS